MRYVLTLILSVFCNLANAVVLNNLYSIDFNVPDNSQTTRTEILPLALEQMLLKVSSSKAILAHPELGIAKQQVDKYINSYSYVAKDAEYTISIKFNEKMVQNLLNKLGRNALKKNRPLVLVWLHSDVPHQEIQSKLDILSKTYGIPMVTPQLNLPDIELRDEQLKDLAKRYRADIILKANVSSIDGEKQFKWELLDKKEDSAWDEKGVNVDAQLEAMLNNLADRLIARYAQKSTTKTNGENIVVLKIDGINDLQSYAKVTNYVKSLAAVKKVEISSAAENQLTLLLSTDGDKQSIVSAISMDHLLVANSDNLNDDFLSCSYR